MSAGYLLLGVATARAGTLPVWSVPALISGLAGLWAGNAVGWILFGLAWVVVGIALRPGKGRADRLVRRRRVSCVGFGAAHRQRTQPKRSVKDERTSHAGAGVRTAGLRRMMGEFRRTTGAKFGELAFYEVR